MWFASEQQTCAKIPEIEIGKTCKKGAASSEYNYRSKPPGDILDFSLVTAWTTQICAQKTADHDVRVGHAGEQRVLLQL